MGYKIILGESLHHVDSLDHFNFFELKPETYVTFEQEERDVAIVFDSVKVGFIKGLKNVEQFNYVKLIDFEKNNKVSYWYITDFEYDKNLTNPVLKIQLDVLATYGDILKTSLEGKLLKIERAHLPRFKKIEIGQELEKLKEWRRYLTSSDNNKTFLNLFETFSTHNLFNFLNDNVSEILRIQEFDTQRNFNNYSYDIILGNTEYYNTNDDIAEYHLAVLNLPTSNIKVVDTPTTTVTPDVVISEVLNPLREQEKESTSFDGVLIPLSLNEVGFASNSGVTTTYRLKRPDSNLWLKNNWHIYENNTSIFKNSKVFRTFEDANNWSGDDLFGLELRGNYEVQTIDNDFYENGRFEGVNYINKFRAANELLAIYHTPFKKPISIYGLTILDNGSSQPFVFGNLVKAAGNTRIVLTLQNYNQVFDFNSDFIFGDEFKDSVKLKDITTNFKSVLQYQTQLTNIINKIKNWDYSREIAIYNSDNFKTSLEINGIKQTEELDFTTYIRTNMKGSLVGRGYYNINSNEGFFNVLINNVDNNNNKFFKRFRLNKLPINSDSWSTYVRQQGNTLQETDYQAEKQYELAKVQGALSIVSGFGGIAAGVGVGSSGGISGAIGIGSITGGINQLSTGIAQLQTADFEKRKIAASKKDLKNHFATVVVKDNYIDSLIGNGEHKKGLSLINERADKELLKATALYYHKFGYSLEKHDYFDFNKYFNRLNFNFLQLSEITQYLLKINKEIRDEIVLKFKTGVRIWKQKWLEYNNENWESEDITTLIEELERLK